MLVAIGPENYLRTTPDTSQGILYNVGCGVYVEMNGDEIQEWATRDRNTTNRELREIRSDLGEDFYILKLFELENSA